MAYEKTNWSAGDVVTAKKLNKLENAIAGNVKDVSGQYEYIGDNNEPAIMAFENAIIENDLENNIANAPYAHAEGGYTTASGIGSHAEGANTTASGMASHAEGGGTTASGNVSHAEGQDTTASNDGSHAEGSSTIASGSYSHAQGNSTEASGNYSHSGGLGTLANETCQTVIGKYNDYEWSGTNTHSADYAFIIGNGTDDNNRSNAFAIKWDGTFVFANGTEITPADFDQIVKQVNPK